MGQTDLLNHYKP